jgi:hypothetical protein
VTWFEILKLLGPWVVSLVCLGVTGWVWVARKTFVSSDEFAKMLTTLAAFDRRMAVVEQKIDAYPTSDTLHVDINRLTQRMAGMEAAQNGIKDLLATQNDYLQMIINKGFKP